MATKNIFQFEDYRLFLKSEISAIKAQRKSFSIRAMARVLNIGATTLNEVLSGEKNLSLENTYNIAQKMNLSNLETDFFILLVQQSATKDETLRKYFKTKIKTEKKKFVEVQKVNPTPVDALANWKSAVIMALSGNSHYPLNSDLISKVLNISSTEAFTLLTELVKLNILKQHSENNFLPTHKNIQLESKTINLALQHYHKEMLKKAAVAIEQQQPKERVIGSETFSFSSLNLKKAEDIINECFDKLTQTELMIDTIELTNIRLVATQYYQAVLRIGFKNNSNTMVPRPITINQLFNTTASGANTVDITSCVTPGDAVNIVITNNNNSNNNTNQTPSAQIQNVSCAANAGCWIPLSFTGSPGMSVIATATCLDGSGNNMGDTNNSVIGAINGQGSFQYTGMWDCTTAPKSGCTQSYTVGGVNVGSHSWQCQ